MATLNCRSLSSTSSRAELNKLMNDYNIAIICIQEYRYVHNDEEPDIVALDIGSNTLFTSSSVRNSVGAAVGIAVKTSLLPLVTSIQNVNDRIVTMVLKGNPKTQVISCYSPHNSRPITEVEDFYDNLNSLVKSIPDHTMLTLGGDFNAHVEGLFSYHSASNTNGDYLLDFIHLNNLIIGNTSFQKPMKKLWTWRSPKGDLAQIDFCIYRKRWRNSIKDCQAFNSSHPVGSDHRIVSTKIRLSLRVTKAATRKQLYWRAVNDDPNLASIIDGSIEVIFSSLPESEKNYTRFVKVCNKIGNEMLPSKPSFDPVTVDNVEVTSARKATLRSNIGNLQAAQANQRKTFDKCEDERINNTLRSFETSPSCDHMKAWKLVRELSGKRSGVVYIQGEDRLNTWKNHFAKLLNSDAIQTDEFNEIEFTLLHETNFEISCEPFSQQDVDTAIKQMKLRKAPGLDGLPLEFWKLPKARISLTEFCNKTFRGCRPAEWGISGIVPIPKKGNLTIPDNYRGIFLTQVAAKVYNRLILNRIRPIIDKLLRPNQNGFRQLRSTTSHILALRRIVEEIHNHNKEAVLVFIDFRKAFDSINRNAMFRILGAYGIPELIVEAIKAMYIDTSALVMTPEGETDTFKIDTGVLQGDPLAPFLFIICLDYAMRRSIFPSDGLTLKRRQSSRHPAEVLADLTFADDICLLEDNLAAAQDLLLRVETATQEVGLYLNASKTKVMHLNPTSTHPLCTINGSEIERVEEFKYLGGYTNTVYDVKTRIGQAWGAAHSLRKVWTAPILRSTKLKVFKAVVESILLYGAESWSLTCTLSKKLDGNYTRLLRTALNVSWKSHTTNKVLYGNLPRITTVIRKRRLTLAGHIMRHDEVAAKVLLWTPDAKRRRGRPNLTLKTIIEEDVGLKGKDLINTMQDRDIWRNIIVSPT